MALDSLYIQGLRNLKPLELNPAPFNILYGYNGSGKTSILEAIYMLATGRSFRAHHHHVITQGEPHLILRGVIHATDAAPVKIAIQKARNNQHVMKVATQEVASIAEIARYLPVQALHLLNYQVLQESPESRRKMMDWAVFHVEHSFLEQWRGFNHLLKQRNAALRLQNHPQALWETQLALAGEQIHLLRQRVCKGWLLNAEQFVLSFLDLSEVKLSYYPGWQVENTLADVFNQNLGRDLALGYTYNGPQRADIQVKYQNRLAQHVLSQGQQKRLVAALLLSQAQWVHQQTAVQGILLIDDLPAELDKSAQQQMMHVLSQLGMQVFLTCVEEDTAKAFAETLGAKLFHVEHGSVRVIE